MANTLNLGNGNWATKEDSLLAYNSENGNFKPLPFDFTRASSATVVNKAGLIETVGSGEPRIDFSNDAKGALLLEPTRSNLYTYSNDVSFWTKSNVITTSDYAISPDGTQNAFRAAFSSSAGALYINALGTTGVNNTLSVWAKSNNGSSNKFRFFGNGFTIISNDYVATDEWQRFEFTYNCSNVTSGLTGASDSATNDILFYGFQHEAGSYATSYIPTQGSAVTRVAESCSQTAPDGVIGQAEGTIFLDSKMALQSINNYQLFSINNVGGSDRIRILTATGNRLRFIYQLDGGALAYSFYNPTDYGNLTSLKIAFTYKSGDIKVYINGVLVDSSTNTFTIAEKLIDIDIASSAGGYSQMFFNNVKLYNTALTDAELQTLTTI